MSASAPDALAKREEIRRFLMARRAAISPESAGLPGSPRRRTPGLRREELASLAGIGVTWYTWFEQGRDIKISADALKRIARALRLTPSDTAYLALLAGIASEEPRPGPIRVDKDVQAVLDGFQAGPAVLMSAGFDVEAYNRLADLVFEFDAMSGPFARNHIWRLFLDPARRSKYRNWEDIAVIAVGALRLMHARLLGDPYFDALIRDLLDRSETFRRLWDTQVTMPLDTITLDLQLPRCGALTFCSVRFHPTSAPDKLLVLLPPADEKTAAAMRNLSGRGGGTRGVGRTATKIPRKRPPAAKKAGRQSSRKR